MIIKQSNNEAEISVDTATANRNYKDSVFRFIFKEKKELEQLNLLLPQLEAEKAQLESILASGTASADEITSTSQRYQQLLEELDTAEMRWLELSEIG